MNERASQLLPTSQFSAAKFASIIISLLSAYILIIPSVHFIPTLKLYDEKRLFECLLLIAIGLLALIHRHRRIALFDTISFFSRAQRILLTGIVALGLISAILSTEPLRALLEVALYILLFYGSLIIAGEYQHSPDSFNRLFINIIQFSSLFCIVSFLSALVASRIESVALLHWELFTNFSHIRFFSQFQSWTLALIVLPVIWYRTNTRTYKFWLALAIASGWWFLLFSSGTRGTLLGITVATVVVTIVFGRTAIPWIKWQGVAAITGLTCFCLFFILPTLISSVDTSAIQQGTVGRAITSSQGRFHLWEIALVMIQENPILGIGPMHYACGITNGIAAHPHSALMQIAAEWGLPVLLIVGFFWLSGISAWIRQGRLKLLNTHPASGSLDTMLYPALLASLVTGSTHAMFSGVIIMPLSQVTMILILGWMTGIHHTYAFTTRPQLAIQFRLINIFLPMLAIAGLLFGIIPDLINSESLLNSNHMPSGTNHYMPRFWQQGLICG